MFPISDGSSPISSHCEQVNSVTFIRLPIPGGIASPNELPHPWKYVKFIKLPIELNPPVKLLPPAIVKVFELCVAVTSPLLKLIKATEAKKRSEAKHGNPEKPGDHKDPATKDAWGAEMFSGINSFIRENPSRANKINCFLSQTVFSNQNIFSIRFWRRIKEIEILL